MDAAAALSCLKNAVVGDDVDLSDEDGTPLAAFLGEQSFTEEHFAMRAQEFADRVYGKAGCSVSKILLRAPGAEGAYLDGVLFRSNDDLLRAGTISAAEFSRRLEIQALETVASLKLKLKAARDGGDVAAAVGFASEWVAKEPDNVTARLILGNALLDKGEDAVAAGNFEEVLLVQPKNFLAWANLALAKTRRGTFSEAVAIYAKLLADYESYEFRYFLRDDVSLRLADALLSDGRADEALSALSGITDRTAPQFAILLAQAMRAQKRFAEARKILEEQLKKNPDDGIARFDLVLSCIDLKDVVSARREYAALKQSDFSLAAELAFLPLFSEKTPGTGSP